MSDVKIHTNTDLAAWMQEGGEQFLQAVGVAPGMRVLDFGCRRGTYALPAARLVGPEGCVYAVDRQSEVLAEVEQQAAEAGLANLRCIDTGGDVRVPLAAASVDVVLLYDVIHLIGWSENSAGAVQGSTAADRRGLLIELARVARPGALLSLYTQHLDTHTDVTSESEIVDEIVACGFRVVGAWSGTLMHDDQAIAGHVVNFAREV